MYQEKHTTLESLLAAVRACRACEGELPLGPRPVLRAAASARILIVGQAPGARVHRTGIPWDDLSGARLRTWMGVGEDIFYDESRIAIIPMGYCYPGRGKGGDLPPRRECARLWLDALLERLPMIELTLLIGRHAQRHFLGRRRKSSLAATVDAWRDYTPAFIPLPHPSPRNTPWLQRHPGFERRLLPELRKRVDAIVARGNLPAHDPASPGRSGPVNEGSSFVFSIASSATTELATAPEEPRCVSADREIDRRGKRDADRYGHCDVPEAVQRRRTVQRERTGSF